MKVLHINRTDQEGGAARAAFRLHQSLREAGIDSKMLVEWKTSNDKTVESIVDRHSWRGLGLKAVKFAEELTGMQYVAPRPYSIAKHPWVRSADIIHLHNVHGGYFPLFALNQIGRLAPIVWTLHDMWPLTGHCSYPASCERWKTGCGLCPLLGDYPPLRRDTTQKLWKMKNHIYRQVPLTVVCPSKWLLQYANQHPVFGRVPGYHIPYGVNTSVFRPIDRLAARRSFELSDDTLFILFGAAHAMEKRKGGKVFLEALQILLQRKHERIAALVFGCDSFKVQFPVGLEHRVCGYIQKEQEMAKLYAAADLFVCPSLADNLPNVILESMSCGTPVVSFKVGGCSELVRHMETGYLVGSEEASDMAEGIGLLVGDSDLRLRMGRRAREVAIQEYSVELQAKRYDEVYQSVFNGRQHKVKI